MKKRRYNLNELILATVLIAVGLFALIKIELIQDYMFWIMVGYFGVRILLSLLRQYTGKISKIYTLVQVLLNGAVIALLFYFRNSGQALSYVILASCAIDVFLNIIKMFIFRKTKDSESFFGMDTIICALFLVLLIINRDSPVVATSVLFGCLVMYKGVSTFLSNSFIRNVMCLSDLGKALNRVHGLDVFFGLIIVLVLASFILPYIEPNIPTIGDAWWYCFAVITTIGFGDISAVTLTGRVLSAIIGFYGIISVSVLTSAIVIYVTEEIKNEEATNSKKD